MDVRTVDFGDVIVEILLCVEMSVIHHDQLVVFKVW
jgi:hypothetical protein